VEIENYLKLVIGATLGISLIIFGLAFWNSATEDYYNKLNGETYEIESCLQYMDHPLNSIGDRDDCLQKRKSGGIFISLGIFTLWGTIYTNRDYLTDLMERNNLL
jgi:hypothetical protein